MSISITAALPFLILAAITTNTAIKEYDYDYVGTENRIRESLKEWHSECSQAEIDEIMNQYKTIFMDSNLLSKTLAEHGFKVIKTEEKLIECMLKDTLLTFFRENSSQPFILKLKENNQVKMENMLEDLSQEYSLNVQELTYMNIKSRIKSQKLQIEKEEILEDDSILITINID